MIAGTLLVLIAFVPMWGSYSSISPTGKVLGRGDLDGWGSYGFATNLALLLTLSLILLIVSRAIGLDLDVPRREWAYTALSLAAAGLLFAALVGGPVLDVPGKAEEHDVARGPLAYVSLAFACLSILGARLHRMEARSLGGEPKPDRTSQTAKTSRGIDATR